MSAAMPLVTLAIADQIAVISLNRPAKRNALNDDMLRQLLAVLGRVEADADVRAVILRGEGSSFCAGIDLAEKLAHRGTSGIVDFALLLEAFERIATLRHPVIAVLQGTSLAGGWELALHCDVRLADPEARFGMPLARLGLVVPFEAARRLVHLAGLSAATDLLLSATLIDGQRAHALGLVTTLVARHRLDAAAFDYARTVTALAPLSVREAKRLLSHAFDAQPPHDAFDEARRRITASDDTAEGLRAFLERREARFCGR